MPEHYALIPAAGSGARMGECLPKQYLELAGKPMIYHALRRLVETPCIRRVYVVIAAEDKRWDSYDYGEGWFYQSSDEVGITGLRDTAGRVKAYNLLELVRRRSILFQDYNFDPRRA